MTIEEAIQVIRVEIEPLSYRQAEAIDMAISALQDMPIHFGRCWDCVSFIAEGEKCKWGLLTGEDGYCHHFCEKYGNNITESPNEVVEKNDEVIEPSDLISRADAIEAVEDNSYGMGSRASVKAIKALPSADRPSVSAKSYDNGYEDGINAERPKAYKIGYNDGYERGKAESVSAERVGEWIPLSERLPNKHENCLITYKWIGVSGTEYLEVDTFDNWFGEGTIIAWQPLPKPYEAKMENTK